MSTRIPQSFIDELITRTDIVELIGAHVSLKKKGREYMACCPFHNEKTPSFTVSPEKQFYHCFGCGAHGTALGFLMDYERLEFLEAVEVLAQRAGLQVPREAGAPPPQSHHKLLALMERAHAHFRACLRSEPVATGYLKDRGLSGEVAARFGLGFAPDRFDSLLKVLRGEASEAELLQSGLLNKSANGKLYDRFRNRIMFAIRDRRGRVIGFGGRVLDDAVPKYMNSPETPVFHKSDVLYGMYEGRARPRAHRATWWWWKATWTCSPWPSTASRTPWPRSVRRPPRSMSSNCSGTPRRSFSVLTGIVPVARRPGAPPNTPSRCFATDWKRSSCFCRREKTRTA